MERVTKLKLSSKVGIDEETHLKLRALKRHEGKSMAQIVIELVDDKFKKTNFN